MFLREVQEQHGASRLFKGSLRLTVESAMSYPSRVSLRKQQEMNGLYMNQGPTTAAIAHTIGALCKDLLFADDAIIVKSVVEKRYGVEPYTRFTVIEVANEKKEK